MSGVFALLALDQELTEGELVSYDLDQDTKLSEETTVLVESYTVSGVPVLRGCI
jgi:hypothetical protein